MAGRDRTHSPDCWYSQVIDIQALERELLRLPAADRAKLAHALLESLDDLSPSEIEALWLDEARRRLMDLDDGLVQAIPAEDVLRKAQPLLK